MSIDLNNLSRNKAIARRNIIQRSKIHNDTTKDISNSMRRSRSRNYVYKLSESYIIHDETIDSIMFKQNTRNAFCSIFTGRNDFGSRNLLSFSTRELHNLLNEVSEFKTSTLIELTYFKQFEKEWEDALYRRSVKDRTRSLDEISIK